LEQFDTVSVKLEEFVKVNLAGFSRALSDSEGTFDYQFMSKVNSPMPVLPCPAGESLFGARNGS